MAKRRRYARVTILTICALLLMMLGQSGSAQSGIARLKVMTSIPLLKDLVERVGGDAVAVESLIVGSGCCHEYEPSALDLKKLAACDLFFRAGLSFDPWADRLKPVGGKQLRLVDLAKEIKLAAGANPHYWWNPGNVHLIAGGIESVLSKARPDRRGSFAANRAAYLGEVDRVAAGLKVRVKRLRERRLVSYAAAFSELYKYFGFQNKITVEDFCEEIEVSPKRLAEAAAVIKAQKIKVIVGETSHPKDPIQLARETGAKTILLWPAANPSGKYLPTLEDNVGRLVAALR